MSDVASNAHNTDAHAGASASRMSDTRERGSISFQHMMLVTLQLAAALLVVLQFKIEASYGLHELLPLIFVGFIVHSLAPLKYRLAGFTLLSFAAIFTVLGGFHGLVVIAVGLGLIALCHLPIRFSYRIILILAITIICIALRGEWLSTPWPTLSSVVLPVLAAMFMFRLAIYLYDLRTDPSAGTLWERLSYFFMLPNVCFLLFPVVDYKTFKRTYYDKPAYDIYQKGLLMIMRGLVHLLVYRTVYYFYSIAPGEVNSLGTAVHYMVSTYMLYLHISGQFHLIVGILCMFGFNLPETHHLFYLASGFNDYWRRINIYWKDFMMKMVYYPVVMRARSLGMLSAIVIATIAVFFSTWALHAYQWFWLRGEFHLSSTDSLFWALLGFLVVINSVIEIKFRAKKRLNTGAWDLFEAAVHSLKVVGMLVTMTVIWTLWNSPA